MMPASKMADLNLTAEHWTMEDLVKFAQDYAAQVEEWKETDVKKRTKNEPPPQLGVKEQPWWDFIPLDHYIVPSPMQAQLIQPKMTLICIKGLLLRLSTCMFSWD